MPNEPARTAEVRLGRRNVGHIARHNYLPDEVEAVFGNSHTVHKTREGRYIARGHTDEGRMTVVVYERRRGAIRVATAREMDAGERHAFRRTRG
ncbi:MAG: BrnT family toxin [Acidobacteria bacterium]|nr:BrnT family toxin [Acidobacteriota bacterium]